MKMKSIFNKTDEIELKELSKTTIPQNQNYIEVLKRIPDYFNITAGNEIMGLILAFNYGEIVGRRCEKDLIKWNALATFYNMKSYASKHNGELPKTQQELHEWLDDYIKAQGGNYNEQSYAI